MLHASDAAKPRSKALDRAIAGRGIHCGRHHNRRPLLIWPLQGRRITVALQLSY